MKIKVLKCVREETLLTSEHVGGNDEQISFKFYLEIALCGPEGSGKTRADPTPNKWHWRAWGRHQHQAIELAPRAFYYIVGNFRPLWRRIVSQANPHGRSNPRQLLWLLLERLGEFVASPPMGHNGIYWGLVAVNKNGATGSYRTSLKVIERIGVFLKSNLGADSEEFYKGLTLPQGSEFVLDRYRSMPTSLHFKNTPKPWLSCFLNF